MEDWKDLDIGDIPSDFFVNDGYEVQCLDSPSVKSTPEITENIELRNLIIPSIKKGYIYRYRLKPLESIRITREDHKTINESMMHICYY